MKMYKKVCSFKNHSIFKCIKLILKNQPEMSLFEIKKQVKNKNMHIYEKFKFKF